MLEVQISVEEFSNPSDLNFEVSQQPGCASGVAVASTGLQGFGFGSQGFSRDTTSRARDGVRQQGHLYAPALQASAFEDYLLERMAERYALAAEAQPTWETGDLA